MTEPWATGRRRHGAGAPDRAVTGGQVRAEARRDREATAGEAPAAGTGRDRAATPVRHRPRAEVIRASMAGRARGPWATGAVVVSLLVLTGVAAADAPTGPGASVQASTGSRSSPVRPGSAVPSGPASGTGAAGTSAPGTSSRPEPAVPVSTGSQPLAVEPAALATALPDERARTAVRVAIDQIGLPYIWGGNGPTEGDAGFDCSGLTTFAYGEAGIELPRTAHTQFRAGPRVPAGAPLQPGDLVFYGTWAKVHHVGMYLGDGRMVNAPTFGEPVQTAYYRWTGDDYIGASRPASSPDATESLPAVPETPDPRTPDAPPEFDAPAAPRPTALPDPVAPQPQEPDSAAASIAGADADIAAGKVPAPRRAVAPTRPTTSPTPRTSTGTDVPPTTKTVTPPGSGPSTPATGPSATGTAAAPTGTAPTGTPSTGTPSTPSPIAPSGTPAAPPTSRTALPPSTTPASPIPATPVPAGPVPTAPLPTAQLPTTPIPTTSAPVTPVPTTPTPVPPTPPASAVPRQATPTASPTTTSPTTTPPTTTPPTTTPKATPTTPPTTPPGTTTVPTPTTSPSPTTPAQARSITLGGRTVTVASVPRDARGLPPRPGAWAGGDRRIVRLAAPTTAALGSTVVLTLADGSTTRWTVRTSDVVTTAQAATTPGPLVVIAPAGPGRWTVLVGRPVS